MRAYFISVTEHSELRLYSNSNGAAHDFVIRNSSHQPQNLNQPKTIDAVPIQMDVVGINSPTTVLKPSSGDFTNTQRMLTASSIGSGHPTPSQRTFLSAAAVVTNHTIDTIVIDLALPFYSLLH